MSLPRVIVALDFSNETAVWDFINSVSPDLCAVKVGKELFTHTGPELVRQLVQRGFKVFLDLKFHDIPNTVAKACTMAAELGVWMIDVHCVGW